MHGASLVDAAACQPVTEPVGVVIAPFAAFGHWHSSKLAPPDHERVLEHPAPFQVHEQTGDRLVSSAAHRRMVRLNVVVCIPTVDVA